MMIQLAFHKGDSVRVKSTGQKGEITQFKVEGFTVNGVDKLKIQYSVNFGNYMTNWFTEDNLEYYNTYDFTPKFELNLLNLLIDFNLDKRNYDMVKQLNELRQQYIK